MSLVTLQPAKSIKVVLIDQRYPYGKNKVYMSTALVVVASQLMAVGHDVRIVDFNIDQYNDAHVRELLSWADVICVSAVGSPYIPQTIQMCERLRADYPGARIVAGGQVIGSFTPQQFNRLFGFARVIQGASVLDLEVLFGKAPSPFDVDLRAVYEQMGEERLKLYLSNEFALFFSQGCVYRCTYCSAPKNRQEQFHRLDLFRANFEYLVKKAKGFGLSRMECYATSLDFFQNPIVLAEYLRAIGEVCKRQGFTFRLRALSCMKTFLKAQEVLLDFEELVEESGLWCVGFGVDGSGETEWLRYKKTQNHSADIPRCLSLCQRLGLRTEVLVFMGDPDSSIREILTAIVNSLLYARWPLVILRPHMAKTFLPGNDEWEKRTELVEELIRQPGLFYNLDVCALASWVTHPKWFNRWLVNGAYLAIMSLSLFGKNATSPILPQGGTGLYSRIAKAINRYMPFDR